MSCDGLKDLIVERILREEDKQYNPVLFYGEPEQTETLLDSLETDYRQQHPEAETTRLSGMQLTDRLIRAIRFGGTDEVHRMKWDLIGCDLLLLTDLAFVSNKMQTEELLYGVLDLRTEKGKRTVIGAKDAAELRFLADRICTVLNGGLSVHIEPD